MAKDKLNYENDVKIECDALDIEWLKQPQLYIKYAELAAKADDDVRRCKKQLNLMDAEINLEIREEREGKVTESLVNAVVAKDIRHIKALDELNDALYNADICSAAVKAMEQKKSALENEVRLWAGSYFAGPKEPRDIVAQVNMKEVHQQKQLNQVRERMKKRLDGDKE